MRNNLIWLACLLPFVACNLVTNDPQIIGDVRQVRFQLTECKGDIVDTKTTYNTSESKFYWAEGDIVGIVSSEGNQLKFPIKPDYYGQAYALFDGRGFELVSGSTYSSYYPFIPDYDLDPGAVPISYSGQYQIGDNSMSGLGNYSFSVAMGSAPEEGSLDFTFRNIGSPHRYRMPVATGDYSSFSLVIPSEKFILSGTINLLAESDDELIRITPTSMTSSLSLDLHGTTMPADGQLRCWMMVPPVNLEGEIICMELTREDGCVLLASVAGRDCPANSRKVFNALTTVGPAINEIGSEGGIIPIQLIRSSASDAVTVEMEAEWITGNTSVTNGLATIYSFPIAENTGAEREGFVSFTETSTGLTNRVLIRQKKAGTIIGIGGWESDNHSGNAD